MNFFEQQDRARRNTGRLVLLMTLAVTSLVALTSLAVSVGLQFMADSGSQHRTLHVAWNLVPMIAVVVVSVVLLGAFYKSLQLREGGKSVAQRLGGRLISLEQHNDDERKVLNVVEEMAIASGSPVPAVYVIEDTSINAFAAGLTPQSAVIGVTRGAIRLLSRGELRGVIAHEFSHIHNGDMRLNTRLVALLHGILVIGLIGEFGMRSAKDGEKAAIPLFLAGAVLWVLGYTGTFFGNCIKAAVSREREFLADASAVQFTRDPSTIGGALKKIAGYGGGSLLAATNAPEFSHLYFGAGVATHVEGFMATHPPLKKRIRRIEPNWDGRFPEVVWPTEHTQMPTDPLPRAPRVHTLEQGISFSLADVEQSLASVGDPQPVHLAWARGALGRLGGSLDEAAHSCDGAQALVYGLLLSTEPALQQQQLQLLKPSIEAGLDDRLRRLIPALQALDPDLRLPLIDLAMPALKQMDSKAIEVFKGNMTLLIKADQRVELLEWTLLRIVERSLNPPRQRQARHDLIELGGDVCTLLSALAQAGNNNPEQARAAFVHARKSLPLPLAGIEPRADAGLKSVALAVNRLNLLWPLQKPQLLKAMARCIEHDGCITTAEAELMRAVASILDCPMPPITTLSVPSTK